MDWEGHANCSDSKWTLEEVAGFRWVGVVVAIVSIIVGTIGNSMTIVTIRRESSLKSTFYLFLISMCGIDLAASALTGPLVLAGYFNMHWPLGGPTSFTVNLLGYFYFCSGYSSVVHLVVITIHRYIEICHFRLARILFQPRRNVYVIIFFSWMTAPSFLLPLLIGHYFVWSPLIFMCTLSLDPRSPFVEYATFVRILFQVAPLLLIPPLYFIMFRRVTRSSCKVKQYKTPAHTEHWHSVQSESKLCNRDEENGLISDKYLPPSTSRKIMIQNSQQAKCGQRKMLVMCTSICIIFAMLFLPSTVAHMVRQFNPCLDPRVVMFSISPTWLNMAVNPIIYGALNLKIRRGYVRLISDSMNTLRNCCGL